MLMPSITAFDRAVVTAAESQLRKNNATGDNLFWLLSNAMVEVAVDKRIGGTDAIVFLAQRDPEKFREGLIGGTTAGLGQLLRGKRRAGQTTRHRVQADRHRHCGLRLARWSPSSLARESNSG